MANNNRIINHPLNVERLTRPEVIERIIHIYKFFYYDLDELVDLIVYTDEQVFDFYDNLKFNYEEALKERKKLKLKITKTSKKINLY